MEALEFLAEIIKDQNAKEELEKEKVLHTNILIKTIQDKASHFRHVHAKFLEAEKELKNAVIAYRAYVWNEDGEDLKKIDKLDQSFVTEVLKNIYQGIDIEAEIKEIKGE